MTPFKHRDVGSVLGKRRRNLNKDGMKTFEPETDDTSVTEALKRKLCYEVFTAVCDLLSLEIFMIYTMPARVS